MAGSPVVFFQLAVHDPGPLREFLEALFCWSFAENNAGRTVAGVDPGGPGDFDLKGAIIRAKDGEPASVSLFVRVEDLDATVARAERMGVHIVVPRTRTAAGTDLVIVRGPEQLVFGIVQA